MGEVPREILREVGVLVMLFVVAVEAHGDDTEIRKDLSAHIISIHERSQIPGLAVAVVAQGKIVFVEGFGVRCVGGPDPVSSSTTFPVGSLTKGFTAAALSILVDRGKVKWDDSLVKLAPDWCGSEHLGSATLRQLLSHRVGVARGDALWSICAYSETECARRFRLLDRIGPVGVDSYSNLGYAMAGAIVTSIDGRTWEKFVGDEIFARLEMGDSWIGARPGDDSVTLHEFNKRGELLQRDPDLELGAVAPALGINSSARDIAKVDDPTVALRQSPAVEYVIPLDYARARGGRLRVRCRMAHQRNC